ncbi:N-acetyltransferase family protein [Roseibium sp. LAB1]
MPISTDSLVIRSATKEDFQGLCALYAQLISNDIPAAEELRLETFDQILAQQGVDILVADLEGTLVATCMLITVPNLTRGCAPFALIENVVTDADYRGIVIGKTLLQTAIDTAFSAGCFKVMLLSGFTNTDAHRFYKNLGFATSKTGFELRAPNYPTRQ